MVWLSHCAERTSATSSPASESAFEFHHRLLGRGHADNAIAPRIAVDQLAFDLAQGERVVVDGEEDGKRHGH